MIKKLKNRFCQLGSWAIDKIHPPTLAELAIRFNIPEAEFVNEQYDQLKPIAVKQRLVLLSTPRCGSTMICDFLREKYEFTMHEYFHCEKLVPYLMKRWKVSDKKSYVEALERFRVGKMGRLGLNVHAGHLADYLDHLSHFSEVDEKYVVLKRRDTVKQAISLYVALRTGQWTNHYTRMAEDPVYDFEEIRRCYDDIVAWNLQIDKFVRERGVLASNLIYEECIGDLSLISKAFDFEPCAYDAKMLNVQKQVKVFTKEFEERFNVDIGRG